MVESLKVITEEKSQRTAEYAFEFAFLNNRKSVTAVHKANIMKLGDGEFLKVCDAFMNNEGWLCGRGLCWKSKLCDRVRIELRV